MSSTSEVHDEILKLLWKIDKKKAEIHIQANLKQKEIKQKKIKEWEDEIESLRSKLHGEIPDPKPEKKRKAYIEDPD